MKSLRISLVAAIAALLGACATPTQLADLKRPVVPAKPVALPSSTCTNIAGAFGKDGEVCVLAGTYRLEKENSQGQLYLGDLPSVYWKLGDDIVLVRGGIWLPRSSTAAPRIYMYQTAGTIRGRSVAEIESARLSAAPKSSSDSSQVATSIAIQNTPANATPMQAGLGAGIASGIVAAFTSGEAEPSLYGEPKSAAFVESIRQYFSAERPAP